MTRFQTALLAAASAAALTACANQAPTEPAGPTDIAAVTAEEKQDLSKVVVTGSRVAAGRRDREAMAPATPPPPPYPAMAAPKMEARGGLALNYAQSMPQPLPGTVNRENYQDVEINGVKLVAQEPVSTFSIDVD